MNNIEIDTKLKEFKSVNWEEGNEQYQDEFNDMLTMFAKDQLIEGLQKALSGAIENDWAQFLYQIHRLKGSGSYVSAEKLTVITGLAQDFLLKHIIKVNPRGKTPTEMYQVLDSFQQREKNISYKFYISIIDVALEFIQTLAEKKIIIEEKPKIDELKNQAHEQILGQQSITKMPSVLSKQSLKGSKKSIQVYSNQEITSQIVPNNAIETQNQSQNIDMPQVSSCCNKCQIF